MGSFKLWVHAWLWVQIVQGIHTLLSPDNSLNQSIVGCGTFVRPQTKSAEEPEAFLGLSGSGRRAGSAAHRCFQEKTNFGSAC